MRRRAIFARWAGWVVATLVVVCCLPLACSKKEPRYPQDHARFMRVDQAVDELRRAYVAQDLDALDALMLPFENLERLRDDIRKDFKTFQDIDVTFSIDRIMIDGETIDVYLHWQGFWKRAPADVGIRERGHGLLRWQGAQSVLLRGVEGDLPFGMSTRLLLSRLIGPGDRLSP